MDLLISTAQWGTTMLIAAFGLVTLAKVLQSNSFAGLLRDETGSVSAGRVQLLVLTILTAMQYLLETVHDPSHLPVPPASLVTVLGGSQLIYLGSKAWSVFGPNRNPPENR